MHKPECVIENEAHEIVWDFDIKTYHPIPSRRQNLVFNTKKERTNKLVDFAVPAHNRMKIKENEKIKKYLDLARELKKLEYQGDSDTICI